MKKQLHARAAARRRRRTCTSIFDLPYLVVDYRAPVRSSQPANHVLPGKYRIVYIYFGSGAVWWVGARWVMKRMRFIHQRLWDSGRGT